MVIGNALNLNFSPNQLIYSPTDYELAGLSTLNNGILATSSLGVPSISNTLPIPVQNNITNLGTIASIGAPLGSSFGGTGVNNGSSTLTLGGSLTTSGAFASTFTMTGITTVTFPTSGTLATTSQLPTGAALTRTNDTNVTLTLGGTPLTALLQATSLTMGWTGQLGLTRGGTAASLVADNGGIIYSTSSALAVLASTVTANQLVMSGSSSAPTWSTATYPPTTTINQLLYSSSANTVTGLSTGNNGVLITSAGGVPSISSTLPTAVQGNITSLGTISSGVWQGTVIGGTYGGTGVNNGASTITIGGSVAFSGAFTFTGTLTNTTAVTFPTSGTLATTSQLPSGAALTVSSDTNVTLTLGGTPATALLQASSVTAGWTGTLALARGGLAANLTASNGGIFYSTGSAGAILSGTATPNQLLLSGASTTPAWSTSTYPTTNAINTLLYASSANTMAALATANSGVLVTDGSGVPSISSTLPSGIILVAPVLGTPASGTLTNCTGLPVAGGGTGDASFTTYMPIVGGTTTTSALQSVSTTNAVTGKTLSFQGTSTVPAWSTIPGQNLLINGDFQILQRFNSPISVAASTTQYSWDRWQVATGATQATTCTTETSSVNNQNMARIQRNNAQTGTSTMRFCQTVTINNSRSVAGNYITLSFRALCGANFSPTSNNITVTVYSGTGATDKSGINGAFTGSATPISTTQALTTSETFYTFTSGSTVGATVTQIAVEFSWTPTGTAGANDWAQFGVVQAEVNTVPSPFQVLRWEDSLRLCQAYYAKTFNQGVAPAQASADNHGAIGYYCQTNGTSAGFEVMWQYPTTMIAGATAGQIVFYNPTSSNNKWYNGNRAADSGSPSNNLVGMRNTTIVNPQVALDALGQQCTIHASVDVDLT